MQNRLVREYVQESGENPYRIWLQRLDNTSKARIQARLLRIEQGNLGDRKSIGDGVWELRFTFGAGYRVYFSEDGETIVLLLLGGDKSSQKKDILRAKSFWQDYLESKKNG